MQNRNRLGDRWNIDCAILMTCFSPLDMGIKSSFVPNPNSSQYILSKGKQYTLSNNQTVAMNRELAAEIEVGYLAPEDLNSEVFLKTAKNGR